MAGTEFYEIKGEYKAEALFEISVEVDKKIFLIIYGNHVGGGYCTIINLKISCEMGAPTEVYYNTQKLMATGVNLSEKMAQGIALAIRDYAWR